MTPQPGGQDDYIKRPFADAEYRDRARRVREEMGRRGVDVLLVLSPPNLCYLTGFESIWYPPRAPVGAILAANDERLVFVDYDRHRTLVERVALYDDAVFYDYSTAVDDLRSAVRARGWQGATIGVERWTQSPGAPLVDEIVAALAGEGANVVAGDWIVDRARLVKSVRRAGVRTASGADRRRRLCLVGRVRAAGPHRARDRRPRERRDGCERWRGVRRSAPWCRQGQTCGAAPTHRRRGARSRSATSCTWTRAGS